MSLDASVDALEALTGHRPPAEIVEATRRELADRDRERADRLEGELAEAARHITRLALDCARAERERDAAIELTQRRALP